MGCTLPWLGRGRWCKGRAQTLPPEVTPVLSPTMPQGHAYQDSILRGNCHLAALPSQSEWGVPQGPRNKPGTLKLILPSPNLVTPASHPALESDLGSAHWATSTPELKLFPPARCIRSNRIRPLACPSAISCSLPQAQACPSARRLQIKCQINSWVDTLFLQLRRIPATLPAPAACRASWGLFAPQWSG